MSVVGVPERRSWPFLVAAICVWVGVVLGVKSWWWLPGALVIVAVAGVMRQWVVCGCMGLLMVGVGSGVLLAERTAEAADLLPAGSVELLVEVTRNGSLGQWGGMAEVVPHAIKRGDEYIPWRGPAGRLRGEGLEDWRKQTRWLITTTMRAVDDPAPQGHVMWMGTANRVVVAESGARILDRSAALARERILSQLGPSQSRARSLLAGFLIGDVSELGGIALEQMRRAGLSHYVAVSGSNVALFLVGLFLVAGPLGWGARRRAVVGLFGLAFFVTLIGPDPSVVRASAMAAIVLIAHSFGLRPSIWTVGGLGVTLLLIVAPQLAFNLGFQLSVAATVGVVVGAKLFPNLHPRWAAATLGASVGAQVAVAPILLLAVGTVPLWSPVANVVAAPFVAFATGVGGLGAIAGFEPLIVVAEVAAQVVLFIAAIAAPLPQLTAGGVAILMAVATGLSVDRLRPLAAVVGVALLAFTSVSWADSTQGPAFVAIDVGQGDALLLIGQDREIVLIDGGASGIALLDGLGRHGVRSIDLLVVTHAHLDHYGGLGDLLEQIPVEALWYARSAEQASEFDSFLEAASGRVNVVRPAIGTYQVGTIQLEVVGPIRRYASVNDQSIVMVATIGQVSVLLTGDIEELAQRDIAPRPVSILKVPHHGGATSNVGWMVDTGAQVAVISVGQNSFGHPSPAIVDGLRDAGVQVRRTDLEGDIVIPLHFDEER